MFKFVHWSFAKCQIIPHIEIKFGREIHLAAYEFIAGRLTSSQECFLTENIFRNQLILLERGGLLKKSTNSLTNKYTCYIWLTERFSPCINQQNNQRSTNSQPTVNHKVIYKKEDISNDISHEDAQTPEPHPAAPIRSKDLLVFNFERMEFEGISEKDIADWKIIFPHIDLQVEILKATQWLKNNPSKSKKSLWRKYLTGWFGRTNDSIENKKAYKAAAQNGSDIRLTKDINGNVADNPYAGKW